MLHYDVLDLFCGCGGFTVGFSRAGYRVVCGVDNWAPAIETYRANFFPQHHIRNLDLFDAEAAVEALKHYTPKVVVGGSPCQGFSRPASATPTMSATTWQCASRKSLWASDRPTSSTRT